MNKLYQRLADHINASVSLTHADRILLEKYFKIVSFKRKDILLKSGETAHQLYFILEGCLRQFFVDNSGQEYSCYFALPGAFLTDLESFSHQQPATHYIDALRHTHCFRISCIDCATLMSQSTALRNYFHKIVEQIAQENIKRTTDLISLTPEQRYQKLENNHRLLIQSIPQKYLASYLGMSAESLSRLKRRRIIKIKT